MEAADRRTSVDRRRRPTPALSRHALFGRRRTVRRAEDPQHVYMDGLGWQASSIVLVIFMFQVLDAWFTLAHVARGGVELNPLMNYFLQMGPLPFVGVKLGFAALGLIFLAMHVRWPLVRRGIAGLFLLYAGVVCYHLILIWSAGVEVGRLAG